MQADPLVRFISTQKSEDFGQVYAKHSILSHS